MKSQSFVEQLQDVIEEVSEWAVETIEDVVGKLTLEGPGFDMVELPLQDQLEEYGKLRGNVQGWYKEIDEIARGIIEDLLEAGVPEEQIASIHPYNLAFRIVAKYSIDMEKLIKGGRYSGRS